MAAASVNGADWFVDFEAGAAFSGYNDVRIPGDDGTKFSLTDDLESEIVPFARARLGTQFRDRHAIELLVAPLDVTAEGKINKDIHFQNRIFPADTDLEATFRFDSYRLTYRYTFVQRNQVQFGAGITGKIRDAEIGLSGGGQEAVKTNTGFVPLINFQMVWRPTSSFGVLIDGDALAGPQGRAEDILIAALFKLGGSVEMKLGYRVLEGGADNDEVYTFSMFHYALAGLRVTW